MISLLKSSKRYGLAIRHGNAIKEASRLTGASLSLLYSIAYEESRFNSTSVGAAGEMGLFQFMPQTWRSVSLEFKDHGLSNPFDPIQAAKAAGFYLNRVLKRELRSAGASTFIWNRIAAYNAGVRNVKNNTLPLSTLDYRRRVVFGTLVYYFLAVFTDL